VGTTVVVHYKCIDNNEYNYAQLFGVSAVPDPDSKVIGSNCRGTKETRTGGQYGRSIILVYTWNPWQEGGVVRISPPRWLTLTI